MTVSEKIIDIIKTMIEYRMLDTSRLDDYNYVMERVKMYLDARSLAFDTMRMSGISI